MKDFDVFISKDGQTYRYLINNANFDSYIKIVKKDAETGNTIPYAGAGSVSYTHLDVYKRQTLQRYAGYGVYCRAW